MANANLRRRKLVAALILMLAVSVIGISTYGAWGYTRHLAVEAYPIADAQIYPEFQFALEHQKRFAWLPGNEKWLLAIDQNEIVELRGDAVAAFDWTVTTFTVARIASQVISNPCRDGRHETRTVQRIGHNKS